MIYTTKISCSGQSCGHSRLRPVLFFLLEIYGDAGGSKVSLQLDDLLLCFTLKPSYHPVPLCTVSKKTPSYSHRNIHPLISQWKMHEIAFCY